MAISYNSKKITINQTVHTFRLTEQGVPGIEGIDTRQLTKIIREKGTMLGKIVVGDNVDPDSVATIDPASLNLVKEVSIKVQ